MKKIKMILFGFMLFSTSIFVGCKDLLLPSSQVWVITFDNCPIGTCGTNVTILKGGAISQKDNAVRVVSNNGTCTYPAPVSGQLSGTIFKFTMEGGGCGQIVKGYTQGDANGEYGTATRAQGTITWTFNNRPTETDTWTAILLH